MTASTEQATIQLPVVRRGYDPEAVRDHLRDLERAWKERVSSMEETIEELQSALDEAREREEAVHLTFVAASKAKEELIQTGRKELDEARAAAEEESRRVVGEARYEALRILKAAREEAEQALKSARLEAGEVRAAAGNEGASTAPGSDVRTDTAAGGFTADHDDLEDRLERMRTVTADLEARLRLVATGALDGMASLSRELREAGVAVAPAMEAATLVGGSPEADVETPRRAMPDIDDTPATNRGSFYTRRSARLPRIGADAANAVAAVTAMRAKAAAEQDQARKIAMHT